MGGANSKISKLKAHAAIKEHMINISRMSGYKNSIVGCVSSQISIAHHQFVENNRNYFKKLIKIVLFLAR